MRYMVRQDLFAIGDDFWVTDEQGNRVFLVDGKVMRLRETLEFQDASGAVVAVIRKKLFTMADTMEIERGGAVIATVRKAMFSPLHHRSAVDLAGGRQLEASGDFFGMEYEIRDGDAVVARISRAWFRLRDTYGVEVAPGQDDALLIAVAVCLDRIRHDEQQRARDQQQRQLTQMQEQQQQMQQGMGMPGMPGTGMPGMGGNWP